MSKVLKVIADILVILFILAAAAIFVPPLFGVTTAVATPQVTTNMQMGTVAYGKRIPLEELVSGDSIIYSGDDYALLCDVDSVDLSTDIVTVQVEGASQDIQFHNSAAKTLFTVPFIGYMSIALQTFEGRIILGLIAALIIVLFIVSEVWGNKERMDREYELEEEEEDDAYFRGLAKNAAEGRNTRGAGRETYRQRPQAAQPVRGREDIFAAADAGIGGIAAGAAAPEGSVLDQETTKISLDPAPVTEEVPDSEEEKKFWQTKAESDAMLQEIAAAQEAAKAEEAARAAAAAEAEAAAERERAEKERRAAEKAAEKERRAEEKKAAKEEKKAAREADRQEKQAAAKQAASEAAEQGAEAQPRTRLQPEGEDFSDIDDSQMAEMESALETALAQAGENDHVDHSKTAAAPEEAAAALAEEEPDEIELAIPVRSLEEILQDAYSNGEDPHIRKDPVTGITLVDFSETFSG